MEIYKNLKTILPGISHNLQLKRYTTFKIGGLARYFFVARTKEDVIRAVTVAKKMKLPFFILGEGSNVLVSDEGFNGLVIKIENCKLKIENSRLYAEAGVPFSTLVKEAGQRGLAGLEWAGGLPGTLGGAVRGNAGAFGSETKDTIVFVEALDKNLHLRKLSRAQCQFGYRTSIFKKRNWIVLAALMRLKKGDKKKIQRIAREHICYRKEHGPLEYPNAGSIFKNCDLRLVSKETQKIFRNVIKKDPFPVIPAAAIIAEAGLKGLQQGSAQVSEKHPNYIINLGGAKAKDVVRLIGLVKKKVKLKFGIVLEEEIQYLGDFNEFNKSGSVQLHRY